MTAMTQRKPSSTPSAPIDKDTFLNRQNETSEWFKQLRDRIVKAFETIEDDYVSAYPDAGKAGRFEITPWQRDGGGGGVMSVMKGQVFEKVGVNISTVNGEFNETFRGQIPGTSDNPNFWASGISLVAHMRNPYVPAVHMNTRYINTGGEDGKRWFGGGADLTPIIWNDTDVADFHASLQACCNAYHPNYYADFSAWCDDYFTLKHRNEKRGAGGIFYDYLDNGNYNSEFAFTRDVGLAFLDVYPKLVRRRMEDNYTESDREFQLIRRGRYVEFNLLYDRGTVFGLNTGGNVEAILMSLPPEARWP